MTKESDILDYAKGQQEGKQAHRLERESLNDPFLADALEGFEQAGNHEQAITELHSRVRLAMEKIAPSRKRSSRSLKNYLLAAAAVILLFVSLAPFIYRELEYRQYLAMVEEMQQAPPIDLEEDFIPVTQSHIPMRKKLPHYPVLRELAVTSNQETIAPAEQSLSVEKAEARLRFETNDLVLQKDCLQDEDILSYALVEEKPEFMGSTDLRTFINWVQERLVFPAIHWESAIQGRVFIQFVITAEGKLAAATVLRGIDPHLDAEALRVVDLSPLWTPAKQHGKPVPVKCIIPVKFQLN